MEELSLTVAEAYDCILVSEEGMVHSFVKGLPGYFYGADLTNERVRELLSRAAFLSRTVCCGAGKGGEAEDCGNE